MRLLIVEDEPALAASLATGLRRRGHAVDTAADGQGALDRALVNDYDVILLDRDLPVIHGDDVCRQLRSNGYPARILMLTAAASLDELVGGFDLGADDYLTKPFRFEELLVRVSALSRRVANLPAAGRRVGDLEVDSLRRVVRRAGRGVQLTSREFAVLELLLAADGRVVSAEELLERAWDEMTNPFTASVRVIMSRLRAKLGTPPLITTVIGSGYCIRMDHHPVQADQIDS